MGFLDNLLGNTQQSQGLQDFVNRYQQGSPSEGYSSEEVRQRYQEIAPNVPSDVYEQSAKESFEKLTPQERAEFARFLQQRAAQQNVNAPDLNRPDTDERFQNPDYLAQMTTRMHQQNPGFLGGLLGGGGSQQGQYRGQQPEQQLLDNPVAKAALAGIAAMALKRMMGNR